MNPDAELILARLATGDRKTLGRVLTLIEDGSPQVIDLLGLIRARRLPRPAVLGITGPPGVGKSTLVNRIIKCAEKEHRVAVLAIDPSSHHSGGALLGDRVRIDRSASESSYFRSFANRGAVGGLARAIPEAIEVTAASQRSLLVVETVGAGQSEIDVADIADFTIVVLAPGLGDEVQAAKAGLIEIGDAIVMNKCDLPGSRAAIAAIRAMIALRADETRRVPVLGVAADTGSGVDELWDHVRGRLLILKAHDEPPRTARMATVAEVCRNLVSRLESSGELGEEHPIRRFCEGRASVTELETWLGSRLEGDVVASGPGTCS